MLSVLKRVNLIMAAILMYSICVFAQDPNTTIQGQVKEGKQALIETASQELTDNLATKISLSDDQKQSIKDAIYQYQASVVGVKSESTPEDATGTEQGTLGTEEGTTGTEQGTQGIEEGTTGTEQGTKGIEEGTTGTEQGTKEKGVDESAATEGTEASKMPQGDMDQWLNGEIEKVLLDNQKAQWEVAKADFWNQIRDKVSTLQQNSNKMY